MLEKVINALPENQIPGGERDDGRYELASDLEAHDLVLATHFADDGGADLGLLDELGLVGRALDRDLFGLAWHQLHAGRHHVENDWRRALALEAGHFLFVGGRHHATLIQKAQVLGTRASVG